MSRLQLQNFKVAAIEVDQLGALQSIRKFIKKASSLDEPRVFEERLTDLSEALVAGTCNPHFTRSLSD